MEDVFGVGDAGQKRADGELVGAQDGMMVADGVLKIEPVDLEEGALEQGVGNGEADMAEIVKGSQAVMGYLVDVEGELGTDMSVGALLVGDGVAVASGEGVELDGNGGIDAFGVAVDVAKVMGEGPDGKGELIGGVAVADERADEIAGAGRSG